MDTISSENYHTDFISSDSIIYNLIKNYPHYTITIIIMIFCILYFAWKWPI